MDLSVYLVTDSNGINDGDFYGIIDEALSAGVTLVQLREKALSSKAFYEKALKTKEICRRYGVPLLINDRLDIALAADADGVHLGQRDIPIDAARRILGNNKIIGATAKTVETAQKAVNDGADYIGIGAFFSTDTKADAKLMTAAEVRRVTDAVNAPFVGIGGLTEDNIDVLSGSGVSGAAVSSAIMRAEDVTKTVENLRKRLKRIL